METNKFAFKADASMLIQAYLRSINGIIGLTDKEIEVTQLIIECVDENLEINKEVRKTVASILGIDQRDFNNYVSRLKRKGALVQKETGIFVNPKLTPIFNEDGISVQIDIYASRQSENI